MQMTKNYEWFMNHIKSSIQIYTYSLDTVDMGLEEEKVDRQVDKQWFELENVLIYLQ